MADTNHITGQIIRLADFLRNADPAVAARAAADRADNDSAYDSAVDRFVRARPTSLCGARSQLQYVRDQLEDVREGDTLTESGWDNLLAILGNVDSLLAELTLRQAS